MKPMLSYYGGKQQIAHHILSIMPEHHHYIEPYCGGAAVFFAKGQRGVPSRYTETINDKNENIISMYRSMQCKESRERLFERLRFTPHSRSEYELARLHYRNPEATMEEKAWATLVIFNQSYGSVGRSWGWGKGVDARLSLTWRNRVDHIIAHMEERLRYVQIDCDDAINVIRRYDSDGVLFYCDPPYPCTDQGEYSGFSQDDFSQLVDALEHCKGSVILSCYDNSKVPKNWEKFSFKVRARTVTGRGKDEERDINDIRTECVWLVDRSKQKKQFSLF